MPPSNQTLPTSPSRILLYMQPHIGDAIVYTAVARWLRKRFPGSWIGGCTDGPAVAILKACPQLDEVWKRPDSAITERLRFIKKLRGAQFDLGITTYANNSGILLMKLGKVRALAGVLGTKYRDWYVESVPKETEFDVALGPMGKLVTRLGCQTEDRSPSVVIPDDVSSEIDLLNLPGRFIVLHHGASHPRKKWAVDRFIEIASKAADHGLATVWIGGKSEASELESLNLPPNSVIVAGKTSALGSMEVIRRSQCLVTNDSGPMHMGAAVGTPMVALFGPTNPEICTPYGDQNILVVGKNDQCHTNIDDCQGKCWNSISVEEVWKGVEESISTVAFNK